DRGRSSRPQPARPVVAQAPRGGVGTRSRGGDGRGGSRAEPRRPAPAGHRRDPAPPPGAAFAWSCPARTGGRLMLQVTPAAAPSLARRLDEAIARAQARLLGMQHPAGYWHAPLEANVRMDAQYIIFNRFVGRRRQETEQRLVARMQALQSDDGSWPLFAGGPGHLSTTIEAYFAKKLAGLTADHPALRRAREFIHAHGGLERAGVFTRCFLAYFGQFPWWGLPAMPVEVVLLPPWFPLNIYAMSSWARETVVPLTVLMAKQPRV